MTPAFSSPKQAATLGIFLALLLALPLLVAGPLQPSRDQSYTNLGYDYGPFHFVRDQIFKEKEDVDIALIGSSRLMYGIDSKLIQEELSVRLGRPAKVFTLGFDWAGYDAAYFIARDLLDHRKVRMIVFAEEWRGGDQPHHAAPHLYQIGENSDAVSQLRADGRAAYYFGDVLSAPRNMLNMIRSNCADVSEEGLASWNQTNQAPDPATTCGSVNSRLGFDHQAKQFVEFAPNVIAQPSDVTRYAEATRSQFKFQDAEVPPLQLHFARKLAASAREHGCQLVYIHLPEMDELRLPVSQERQDPSRVLGVPISLIGIAPERLFAGLSDEDARKLFMDVHHFNVNGQRYFTRLITPRLLEIYGSTEK